MQLQYIPMKDLVLKQSILVKFSCIFHLIITHPTITEEKIDTQYGCSETTGQEIEDMGGSGTAGSHWEKRLVANEFMNPQVADNPVLFSALTLALFEDGRKILCDVGEVKQTKINLTHTLY